MQTIDWLGFAVAVTLIELTPGPNMAWLAGLSIGQGRKAGFAATAGVALGLLINGLLAAAGLAVIIASEPRLFTALRWAGSALLLFLAWQSWREADQPVVAKAATESFSTRNFVAGLLTNILNPKALLFYMVVIPQFSGGRFPTFAQAAMLTTISASIATAVHILIVLGGDRAHNFLNDPAQLKTVRRALALVLVGVAIWFFVGAVPKTTVG